MGKRNRHKGQPKQPFKGLPRLKPIVVKRTYLGTEFAGGDRALRSEDRRTRCFELAGHAVVFGSAPAGALVVHGSWHGPKEGMERIAHAWVELPGGFIWEPISCNVYPKDQFDHWAAAWPEYSYSKEAAISLTRTHDHYGPWSPVKYGADDPIPTEKEAATS